MVSIIVIFFQYGDRNNFFSIKKEVKIPKWMQRGLRVITLQGAIEKSPVLLSQYWKLK